MVSVDYRDVAVRAFKTFMQTAVSVLIAEINGADLFEAGRGFWMGVVLSAGAAGVSAVWNGVIEPVMKRWTDKAD